MFTFQFGWGLELCLGELSPPKAYRGDGTGPICAIITLPHLIPHYASSRRPSIVEPPTRWDLFVAATMLRSPEPIKERVEPRILSIRAIEINHLTWFTFLLLLRIQRYMWWYHVVTWAYANDSDRNLELNNVWVSCLHYILEYNYRIGFEFQKLKSLYRCQDTSVRRGRPLCHGHPLRP